MRVDVSGDHPIVLRFDSERPVTVEIFDTDPKEGSAVIIPEGVEQ